MLSPLAFWLHLRPLAWCKSFHARQSPARQSPARQSPARQSPARQSPCALAFVSVAAIVLYLFK
jgi:hypothetical protein